ncbi:MAG: hypothetical protein COB30_000905 [Ectothiorhodospiraceae bacterium]|nr:hypothetical protein [Ectothiorhodospiraceae bacterium]
MKRHFSGVAKGVFAVTLALQSIYPVYDASAKAASAQDVHEIADMCMYSQRILKDYALVGMGVTYHDPAKDLITSAKTINKYIIDLESHHLKKSLDDEIRELEGLWKEIEPQLLEKPVKKRMTFLHKKVEQFSHRCEVVADHVATDTGIEGEHYVVLVAQLGMESQRLAALYMMKAWGIADDNYYEEVEEVLKEYEDIYHELLNADEKLVSPEIKEKLKSTEKHFLVFEFMASSKSGRFVPTMAEKSASKIFDEIREILKLEEELVEHE